MLGETRGSHGLWVFHRAVPDALLGVDPHQSQSSCPTSLSSPKPDKNENKMINWMVEGQPPRGFSWTRRGVSDKCLGLMSTLQSSRRRCIKHRLSAGKAGERPAMKQEEQGPPDGILWPERLWLGAGDAEVTRPPNQGASPKARGSQKPEPNCSLLPRQPAP